MSAVTLISFDIDGTLEVGEPPGIVPVELVRVAKRLGYVVGSCSDRPISHQQDLWVGLGIDADFTVLKHRLEELRERFPDATCYHVGDTETDERYALAAGFRFLSSLAPLAWQAELFGAEMDTC